MAMANVTLTCSKCETTYTIRKQCNNRTEANNFESYMESQKGLCPECWKNEQQQKREQERQQIAEKANNTITAAGIVFPELIGSEKQIKWASDIRNRVIEQLTKYGIKWDIIANGNYPENLKSEVNRLFETSAKKWIESRGTKLFRIYIE